MKKNNKEKKNVKKTIRSIFKSSKVSKAKENFMKMVDIPIYMQKDLTRVSVFGISTVCIEQYENIMDCLSHYIKIKCYNLYVVIEGKDLKILEISDDDLLIEGTIDSISYKK